MRLTRHFIHFLENTVNLNQSRIDLLDERVKAITSFLEGHETIGPIFIEVIPQGSYAHRTIIKPVRGRDFDADVLLNVEEQIEWAPKEYIAELYAAFRSSSTYKELVDRKTRCATVDYANDFHVDVVPYLERGGAGKYITNRKDDRFEFTNPEGFNEWLDEKNRITKNHLVEVIRLVKFIRDFKSTFSIKSVALTTLLGRFVEQARVWGDPDYYGDMPTALLHVTQDLDRYLQDNPTMPTIEDPSQTGENFSDRWDQGGYAIFRDKFHFYSDKIAAAYAEEDEEKSVALWQEVFGPDFKEPPALALLAASHSSTPTTEQFLDRDFKIPFVPSPFTVRIDGRILPKKGFRSLSLSQRGNRVEKGRRLNFTISRCDVPEPFDVYWKVRNAGAEAEEVDQLRGEIRPDAGNRSRGESTKYRGSHWVECYIVKDRACVASDRQLVFVT